MNIKIKGVWTSPSNKSLIIFILEIANDISKKTIFLQEGESQIDPPDYLKGEQFFKNFRTICQRASSDKKGRWRVETQQVPGALLEHLTHIYLPNSGFVAVPTDNVYLDIIEKRKQQVVRAYCKDLTTNQISSLLAREVDPDVKRELRFLSRNLSWLTFGGYEIQEELDHMLLKKGGKSIRRLMKLQNPVASYNDDNQLSQLCDSVENKILNFSINSEGLMLVETFVVFDKKRQKEIMKKRMFLVTEEKCSLLKKEELAL